MFCYFVLVRSKAQLREDSKGLLALFEIPTIVVVCFSLEQPILVSNVDCDTT
jgi:hypothetical protein